jgi:outer membrane protein TolC
LIDKSEILRIETSVYQSETSIALAKKQLETQKIQLKNILGLDLDEELNLFDVNIYEIPVNSISLRNDIQKAVKDGLTAQSLQKDLEIIKAQEKVSRSDLLPQVNGEYGYESLKESSFKRGTDKWQWRVGLSFSWKLFNFGSGLDSYKSAKLETKKVEIANQDAIQTLKEQITSAYLDMKTYQETIKTNRKAMETAEQTFEIDKEKFNNRLIDAMDFLKTEVELRDAQLTYINSQLDFYLSYERYLTLLK